MWWEFWVPFWKEYFKGLFGQNGAGVSCGQIHCFCLIFSGWDLSVFYATGDRSHHPSLYEQNGTAVDLQTVLSRVGADEAVSTA